MLQIKAQIHNTSFGIGLVNNDILINKIPAQTNTKIILDFFITLAYNTSG